MKKYLSSLAAAAVIAVGSALSASASIALNDGDYINPVDPGQTYTYEELVAAETADYMVSFQFKAAGADRPLPALAITGNISAEAIVNPYLQWFDRFGDLISEAVISSVDGGFIATLPTVFMDGPDRRQTLKFGWENNPGDPANDVTSVSIQVKVSAVPLPAAGLILLTALGGASVAYRRKRVSA